MSHDMIIAPSTALDACMEWLAVPPEDRKAMREALWRMRSVVPIDALPALGRLINMLDVIDSGRKP